jgi:PAS domain S-box-containing protein
MLNSIIISSGIESTEFEANTYRYDVSNGVNFDLILGDLKNQLGDSASDFRLFLTQLIEDKLTREYKIKGEQEVAFNVTPILDPLTGNVSDLYINWQTKQVKQELVSQEKWKEGDGFNSMLMLNLKGEVISYKSNFNITFEQLFKDDLSREQFLEWSHAIASQSFTDDLVLPYHNDNYAYIGFSLIYKSVEDEVLYVRVFNKKYDLNDVDLVTNQNFSRIFDNIPMDVIMWNNNQEYIYINKNAIKSDEIRNWLIGKTDLDYCIYRNKPLDIAYNRRNAFNEALFTKKRQIVEEKFEVEGSYKIHVRIIDPILSKENEILNIIGYGIDISALRNSQDSISHLNYTLNEAREGVALLNPKGEYYYLNHSHISMFGFESQDELLGKTWHVLYEQDEIDRLNNEIFPVLAKEKIWIGETRALNKQGEYVYQEVTLTIAPNNDMVCFCRDINQRKREQIELEKLATVAKNTSNLVLICDKNYKIEFVNKSFEDITGFKLLECKGKDFYFNFNFNDDNDRIIEEVRSIDKNSDSSLNFQVLQSTKYSQTFWSEISVNPIVGYDGEMSHLIFVERDITPQKQVESSIKESLAKEKELSEMKSQFVNLASHEIRTPLASISSSAEMIKLYFENKNVDSAKVHNHLNKISIQITRLSELLSNLLFVGKMDAASLDLNLKLIDIKSFITELVDDYNVSIDEKKQRYLEYKVVSTVTEPVFLNIDKVLITHAIINIINNAFKYSEGKQNPLLVLKISSSEVEVCVTDYGIGIPVKEQKNLFKSFWRASNTINIPGIGLGLVFVKKIIEVSGGYVSIDSEVNKYTTIKVCLPVKDIQ